MPNRIEYKLMMTLTQVFDEHVLRKISCNPKLNPKVKVQ